jgi:hypothetical protein
MGQSLHEVIELEVNSEETSLPAPRFDEAASQVARPVVPLPHNAASFDPVVATNSRSWLTIKLQGKRTWLLATIVCLFMAVGAIAFGVIAYRRSPAVSTQPLIPAADASKIEIDQVSMPARALSSTARVAAMPRPVKRRRSNINVFPGRPKPRLVDSYVIH